MTVKVPVFKDTDVTKFMIQFIAETDRNNRDTLSAIEGNRSLLLYSPSKKVYEVKVTDAGVLTVTKVAG
jgi:hypothetical protein